MMKFVSLTKHLLFPMIDMLLQLLLRKYIRVMSLIFVHYFPRIGGGGVIPFGFSVHIQTLCNYCKHREMRK